MRSQQPLLIAGINDRAANRGRKQARERMGGGRAAAIVGAERVLPATSGRHALARKLDELRGEGTLV